MASSSSKKKLDGKELLYVFVWHKDAVDYVYSLFALGIPSHDTIVGVKTGITLNTMVKGIMYPISSIVEPKRTPVTPVLRFPAKQGWPNYMRCICLDRRLYFVGGKNAGMGPYSTRVHVLDLDDPTKALRPIANMNTGKSNFFVSFVADGQIFVVCGCRQCPRTGVPFTRFETFRPTEGVWTVPKHQPTFPDALYLYPPIVLDRAVFFAGEIRPGKKFTCLYNIDTGFWTNYCPMDDFTPTVKDMVVLGGAEAVGETLWNVYDHPETEQPVVVRIDLAPVMGKMRPPTNNKFFGDILRYCIPDQVDEGLGVRQPAARLLTRLAEDRRRPLSSCLCFLQLEPCNGLVDGEIRISAQLFDVHGDGAGSAEYLTSAHFFVPHYETRYKYYQLMDAHLV